jgi:hypothetical protein
MEKVQAAYVQLQIFCFIFGLVTGFYFGARSILHAFVYANAKWARFLLRLFGAM